jgi:hypothetical protein
MGMDKEWMYQTSWLDPSYLVQVKKFVAIAEKHHLSLKWSCIICSCNCGQNKLAKEDNVV